MSGKSAIQIMLALTGCVMVFHLLVLLQVIPYTIVWAGRLKSVRDMQLFETASLAVNFILLISLLRKGHILAIPVPEKIINGILWVFAILFALNTFGNLFAENRLERYLFTPLTFLSAWLCWRIASGKPVDQSNSR